MKTIVAALATAVAVLAGTGASTVQAQQITIGTATTPSIDPHFLFLASNIAYFRHVFGSLTVINKGMLEGDLAVSWKATGPTQWEFKLRPNVKFHDGEPFSAEDVAFSIERVSKLPNNPVTYAANLGSLKDVQVVDPLTIRLNTARPEPLLPTSISRIAIVSRKAAANASAADFNSGKATIGTGPFRFSAYVPGERYELVRNDAYHGTRPAWQKVVFRVITQDASRIAALLAGDVDLIESVPPADAAKLRGNADLAVHVGPSHRFYFLYFNLVQDSNPFITDRQGKPLGKNPFKDIRVREAVSLAMDRQAIVTRVMDGAAEVINQFASPRMPAFNRELAPLAYDPVKAKKLLADAGYPEGFGLTVHCSNDRYPNDGRMCQTVGQMLARIGLEMKVEAMPKAIYFSKVPPPKAEFALGFLGWGDSSGEASTGLNGLVRSYDATRKTGLYNAAGYSNAEIDRRLEALAAESDPALRNDIQKGILALVAQDIPYVPLYVGSVVAVSKKGIAFNTRPDELTLATEASPAK